MLDFDDANYTYLLYDLVYLFEPFKASFTWETWNSFNKKDDVFDLNRGNASDFYEKRKIDYLDALGREKFFEQIFG